MRARRHHLPEVAPAADPREGHPVAGPGARLVVGPAGAAQVRQRPVARVAMDDDLGRIERLTAEARVREHRRRDGFDGSVQPDQRRTAHEGHVDLAGSQLTPVPAGDQP